MKYWRCLDIYNEVSTSYGIYDLVLTEWAQRPKIIVAHDLTNG